MRGEDILLEGGYEYIKGLEALDDIKRRSYNRGCLAGFIFGSLCVCGVYRWNKKQQQKSKSCGNEKKDGRQYYTL